MIPSAIILGIHYAFWLVSMQNNPSNKCCCSSYLESFSAEDFAYPVSNQVGKRMKTISISRLANVILNRSKVSNILSVTNPKRSIALVLVIVALFQITLGINYGFVENVDAANSDVCNRTPEIAHAILAEVQKTRPNASCVDISDTELAAIQGELKISPSSLERGDFYGLTSVETLEISGGSHHIIPSEAFLGLDSLNRLSVNSDSLTTVHGEAFAGLQSLTSLHLHDDNIRAVPRDLFQDLGNLQSLLLHTDGISSLPIGVFDGLSRLRVLDLHTDNIKGLPNGVLAGMPNLRRLHYRNVNTGVLETGVFRGMPDLELLYLEGSGITKMGTQPFAGLTNLQRLHLNGNSLETIPPSAFRDVPNLRLLHLHGNSIGNFSGGTFEGLRNLQQLYLHGNSINDPPNELFRDLRNLRELHMHDNQIETLPPDLFKGLASLEELFLHNNKLTDISDLDLSDQTRLEWIDVEGNMLTTLPDDLLVSPPCSLRIMAIGANPFDGLPSTTIDGTEYALLDTLPQPTTPGCSDSDGLTDLYLHDIPLTEEELTKIRDEFTRIERLTIGNTGISGDQALDLVANGAFENLVGIALNENDLSSWNSEPAENISDAFSRHDGLVALDLAEIGIDGDTALTILESLNTELERFSFSDNDFSNWNDADTASRLTDAFSGLPESEWTLIYLENTSIDDNAAAAIMPPIATSLGSNASAGIDLSGNQLTKFDASWLEDWEVLQRLYISDNQITAIDPAVFAPIADHLTTLHLDGNPLAPVPARDEFDAVLPNLEELELPPAIEPTPTPETPQRLPATGGEQIPQNLLVLLLIAGAAALVSAVPLIRRSGV